MKRLIIGFLLCSLSFHTTTVMAQSESFTQLAFPPDEFTLSDYTEEAYEQAWAWEAVQQTPPIWTQQAPGFISVYGDMPEPLTLVVNGEVMGELNTTTPFHLEVPAGHYQVEVRLSNGTRHWTQHATVSPGLHCQLFTPNLLPSPLTFAAE